MAVLLDGKRVAAERKANIQARVASLTEQNRIPGLAIVIVGADAASRIYADRMAKLAGDMGFAVFIKALPAQVSQTDLLQVITELNADPAVQGILPMMPLPAHLDADLLAAHIQPDKDIDGLNPLTIGLVAAGKSLAAPCTPRAVMAILDHYHIELSGRKAVIIGRSNVVGKPLIQLLLARNATVMVCHSKTQDLAAVVSQGDIVIAAVGKANLVQMEMIKPGAVVIDVGINEVDGKMVGDVDFTNVAPIAGFITPVPGGVGSVTTTMVLEAVLQGFNKF
ncbi:bifunctional 5,10-methylenetetrahydrofolate dehydrogenase/5,10-methenyltetrahydrofolate cyclohydrolase [Anaerospora hongkongensis]|uniref:bifunctional 5,10-methylenetetrahydrofolate dehydrogenase/5,10-methenyltetrahydrofolate cyclohydrolase n=1 Tax=Anaerospora hongkongensis TaxID=244830 RepID=UPI00289B7046|nr:bifunctional 5,10-methylenetetrahydrofolate dehydrogenase/5,10-methenyltetrahydrofolate cyclohydrolase [Anaerospora hongkongensis]